MRLPMRMQVAAVLLGTQLIATALAGLLPSALNSAIFSSPTIQNTKTPISSPINDLGYIAQNPPIAVSPSIVANTAAAMAPPYFDILHRREGKFILWIPGQTPEAANPPKLILGTIDQSTSPATFKQLFSGPLTQSDKNDLFELDPNTISPALQDNSVYWYWFEVTDTSSQQVSHFRCNPLSFRNVSILERYR